MIAASVALVFEVSRTVRDWLFIEFLKKRSCHRSSADSGIVLQTIKPIVHANGTHLSSNSPPNNGKTEVFVNENGHNSVLTNIATANAATLVPVIATGTLRGSGKSCHRASFHVGLFELSFSTLLHMFQVLLGYILMLMVMTFNVWIFLAVLVGTSIGFFMFDSFNKKIHALKTNATSTGTK